MTSTSTEDEKGSWWTDRAWKKRAGENIKGSGKTKWGKELGNQKRAPGDNGKYLIVEWQGEQQLQDCYLPAAGCLAFQALGVGIVVTWKHLWCVLPQDPAPYRNGNSHWWRRFLCSPSAWWQRPHESTSHQTCCTPGQAAAQAGFLGSTVRNIFHGTYLQEETAGCCTKGRNTNCSPSSFFHHPRFVVTLWRRGCLLQPCFFSSWPQAFGCCCFREEILESKEHFSCRVFKENKNLERRKIEYQ